MGILQNKGMKLDDVFLDDPIKVEFCRFSRGTGTMDRFRQQDNGWQGKDDGGRAIQAA